ncbi:MAG: site-2 protease family protein [Chthonomonadales bacterium]|nr:site-2 protease family protein [Chthonomonadales bacterium]
MDVPLGILYLIVTISLLVLAHEAGHFLMARWCRMRVEDFSLFFGPVIARLGRRGDTEFHIRSIPFGGFVRIAGMEPEDVSGGIPVLKALSRATAQGDAALDAAISRLGRDTLNKVAPDNIRTPVREVLATAIGEDGRLTPTGIVELSKLRGAEDANADETKLIELVLNAHQRAEDPGLFANKPLYQRALVILAGPVASLLFGFFVFCLMGITSGLPTKDSKTTNQVAEVVSGGEASRAGLRTGDWIVAIDGVRIVSGKQMVEMIHSRADKPTTISVRRGKRTFDVTVTPKPREFEDENGKTVTWGAIGIVANVELRRVGLVESVKHGAIRTAFFMVQLVTILSDHRQAKESVGGPIAMGHMATQVQRLGLGAMMLVAAQFSLSLGVLNLLPVPVLDGGHLLLIAIEGIRRRKLSPREVYGAHAVGLGIIALLIIAVTYNDIARLVAG